MRCSLAPNATPRTIHRATLQFMSSLARIGIGVGTAALQSELGMLGIVPQMLPMVEQELNREGLSLGPLANPPRLTTFASMRQARAA